MNPNPEFNLQNIQPAPIEDPFFDQTFYDIASIGTASFIGGPLAGSILVRRNFIQFGKPMAGNITLGVGVISTLLLVAFFTFLSPAILAKIPGFLIPLIYITLITVWVGKIHGDALNLHLKAGGAFFSRWKAAGVGFLGMLFFMACFLPPILLTKTVDSEKYLALNSTLVERETKALTFPKPATDETTIRFLKETGIPAWEKNLEVIEEMKKMDGLTPELVERNAYLQKFNTLKLKIYRLVLKSFEEGTRKYDGEVKQLTEEVIQLTKSVS